MQGRVPVLGGTQEREPRHPSLIRLLSVSTAQVILRPTQGPLLAGVSHLNHRSQGVIGVASLFILPEWYLKMVPLQMHSSFMMHRG